MKKLYVILFAALSFLLAAFLIFNKSDENSQQIINKKDSLNIFGISPASSDNLKEKKENQNKIILIGIDGADKDEIDKLISSGKLPNLKKIISSGVYGNLKSIKPLLSPIIWTSIATGKNPLRHGITDFLTINKKTGDEIPVSSNLRRVKALWNIFSDYKKEAGVIGWLVTWPAEKINGYIVSDHITYLDYNPHLHSIQSEKGLVYPEQLIDKIKPQIILPQALSFKELNNFINADKNKYESELQKKKGNLFNAASVITSTETIKNIAVNLYKENKTDFLSVYFKGIDSFSHLFANQNSGSKQNPVAQFYIYQDSLLGEIIKLADDSTTIFVVSDHGFKLGENTFKSSSEIGKGNAVDWHNDNGIIIISGNKIKKNTAIINASVLDVAPTILYLAGLPVAEDMEGKILNEVIENSFLKKNPVKKIATFEKKKPEKENEEPISSGMNTKIKDELETLGYLNTGTANSYNNIGNLYMNQGNFKLAVKSFEKAVELEPDIAAYHDNLGSAYNELKLFDEALEAHKKAISLDPTSAKAYNNLGRVFAENNNFAIAKQNYEKAILLNPDLAEAYNNLGELYHKQGKINEAINFINKALEKEPDHSLAHYNLAVLFGEKENHLGAVKEFEKVLKIDPAFYLIENVYNGIGIAYFKLKDYKKSLENFKKTFDADPNFPEIHMRLGITNIMLGMTDEGISELKKELSINPDNEELINLINNLDRNTDY